MKRMIIAAMVALAASSAYAETISIATTPSGNEILLDKSSVRQSGKTVSFIMVTNATTPQHTDTGGIYYNSRAMMHFDCAEKTVGTGWIRYYDQIGHMIGKYGSDPDMIAINPNGPFGAIYRQVCKRN